MACFHEWNKIVLTYGHHDELDAVEVFDFAPRPRRMSVSVN